MLIAVSLQQQFTETTRRIHGAGGGGWAGGAAVGGDPGQDTGTIIKHTGS